MAATSSSSSSSKPPVQETGQRRTASMALDHAWHENANIAKKPRTRTDLDPVAQANRAILDHYKNVPSSIIDGEIRDGKSLRKQLIEDKTKAAADKKNHRRTSKFGPSYYANLLKRFQPLQEDAPTLPKEGKPSEPVWRCFVQAVKPPICRQPMRDFLTCVEQLSRKDFLAIAQLVELLSPSGSKDQLDTLVVIARAFWRLRLDRVYAKEMQILAPKFDKTLLQVPFVESSAFDVEKFQLAMAKCPHKHSHNDSVSRKFFCPLKIASLKIFGSEKFVPNKSSPSTLCPNNSSFFMCSPNIHCVQEFWFQTTSPEGCLQSKCGIREACHSSGMESLRLLEILWNGHGSFHR